MVFSLSLDSDLDLYLNHCLIRFLQGILRNKAILYRHCLSVTCAAEYVITKVLAQRDTLTLNERQ